MFLQVVYISVNEITEHWYLYKHQLRKCDIVCYGATLRNVKPQLQKQKSLL